MVALVAAAFAAVFCNDAINIDMNVKDLAHTFFSVVFAVLVFLVVVDALAVFAGAFFTPAEVAFLGAATVFLAGAAFFAGTGAVFYGCR